MAPGTDLDGENCRKGEISRGGGVEGRGNGARGRMDARKDVVLEFVAEGD